MKKNIKMVIKTVLFCASCIGIWTIFGDGWWKLIGVLSVLYMALTTICTGIDERRANEDRIEQFKGR